MVDSDNMDQHDWVNDRVGDVPVLDASARAEMISVAADANAESISKRRTASRMQMFGAAAAVVLVVGLGVTVLGVSSQDNKVSNDAAVQFSDDAEQRAAAESDLAVAESKDAGAAPSSTAASPAMVPDNIPGVDIGTIEDNQMLIDVLTAVFGTYDSALQRTAGGETFECPVDPSTGTLVTLRWGGTEAELVKVTQPTTVLYVVNAETCEILSQVD